METPIAAVNKRHKDNAITLRISKQQKYFLAQAAKIHHIIFIFRNTLLS
jgi:uncharacterized protein (DUF1778 family)